MRSLDKRFLVGLLAAGLAAGRAPVEACPFCSAVSLTFSQEIAQSEAAVIARLVEPPAAGSLAPGGTGPLPQGTFAVVEVLKGGAAIEAAGLLGPDAKTFQTILLEDKPAGTLFLLMAVEPPKLVWSSPILVSDRAIAYLRRLGSLPEKGPERLAFFQDHLEDDDTTLSRDAYDEFAVAPYADVKGLADSMQPAQLLAWIEDPKVQANHRRLYATMLGVCGTPDDARRIGAILEGSQPTTAPEVRSGLDALIACYVTLLGPSGLDLVDRLFLRRSPDSEIPFAETYAAVMALRFLGEESDQVPRERVLASLRLLLDEPKLADLVVADLARWQDWSVVERLAGIFKDATADNIFVREPIVNYLRACPLPEAARALAELEKIDPEAVRRAATLAGLAGLTLPSSPAPDGSPAAPPQVPGPGGEGPAVAAPGERPAIMVAPVIAENDGADPGPAGNSGNRAAADPSARGPAGGGLDWRWVVWTAAVLAIAALTRIYLRPSPAGAAARRYD